MFIPGAHNSQSIGQVLFMLTFFCLCQLELFLLQEIWKGLEILLYKLLRGVAGHLLPRDTGPFPLCFQRNKKVPSPTCEWADPSCS